MISLIALIVGVVLISVSALLTAAAAAVPLVSRGRTRRLAEAQRPGAEALERLQEPMSRTIGAASLVTGVTYAAVAALSAWALWDTYEALSEWVAALVGLLAAAVVVFALGEALPRTIAVQNPEGVALAAARWALPIVRVAHPAARVLAAPWRGLIGLAGGERASLSPWSTDDDLRAVTQAGAAPEAEEEAAREETEERLLDAVSDFTGKVVREVMVPRTDMTCLEDTATVAEALDAIEQCGYSRLPVYHETVDDIRGVLYAKDLLLRVGRGTPPHRPASIARPAFFVPETKPVQELLLEMRAKTHIAIVADEYGGTAGLVTIEDLIEEIVGEIFDEYDSQVPMVFDLGDGRMRVDARMPVDDLNDAFGTAIETEADTVGGLFTEIAGRIPEEGEEIEVDGVVLAVVALEGARIRHLVVGPAARKADEEGHDA